MNDQLNKYKRKLIKLIFLLKNIIIRFFFDKKYNQQFLNNKFYRFNDYLKKNTGYQIQEFYKYRYFEIMKLIEKYDIKSVVEIGTGRTTLIFNNILNIKTKSFEQDRKWIDLLEKFDKKWLILFKEVEIFKNGGRLKGINKQYSELLYIDGPYINKKFKTFTTKPAYYDFESIIDLENPPKAIMVDGRTDTVDLILSNKKINDLYEFKGSFFWSAQRKILRLSHINYHSIWILK